MSENKKETPLKTVAQQLKYNTIDNKSQLQYDDRGYIGKKSTPHKGGLANPKIKKEGYNTMSKFIDFPHYNKNKPSYHLFLISINFAKMKLNKDKFLKFLKELKFVTLTNLN